MLQGNLRAVRNQPQSSKHRLFRLLHHFIEEYSVPHQFYMALMIIEALQIVYFCFYPRLYGIWTLSAIQYIRTALAYISFIGIYAEGGELAIIIIGSIFTIVYGIATILILYSMLANKQKVITEFSSLESRRVNSMKLKYLEYLYSLSKTIVTIPISALCISSAFIDELTMAEIPQQKQYIYMVYVVTILPMIFYSFFLIISMVFIIDYSAFNNLPISGKLASSEAIKQCGKIIISIFGVIAYPKQGENQGNSEFSAFTIIIILWMLYLISYSYYNVYVDNINKLIVLCNQLHSHIQVTILWFFICCLINQLLVPFNNLSLIFLGLGLIPFNLAWKQVLNYRQNKLMASDYSNLTDSEQIIAYNLFFLSYVHRMSAQPQRIIQLEGILRSHILTCKKNQIQCKCQTYKNMLIEINQGNSGHIQRKNDSHIDGDSVFSKIKQKKKQKAGKEHVNQAFIITGSYFKDKEKQKNLWYLFLESNIECKIMNSDSVSIQLLLYSSYLNKYFFNDNFKAIKNIEKSEYISGIDVKSGNSNKNQPIRFQFLRYRQKRVIQAYMKQQDTRLNEKNFVNINKFYEFQVGLDSLLEKIKNSALEHLQFWKVGPHEKKDSKLMLEKACTLFEKSREIKKQYHELEKNSPENVTLLIIFAAYSKIILSNPKYEQENLNKVQKIQDQIKKCPKFAGNQLQKDKYSQNSSTAVIIISGQKYDLGIVKYCTSKITKLYKYSAYEIIGQSVNTLIPTSIAHIHNDILLNYLQAGKNKLGSIERLVPVKDKNNYLVLSRMMVKTLPNLLNGLELVGMINKIQEYHPRHNQEKPKYALYRIDTGKIEIVSESFSKQLGYEIQKISQQSEIREQLYVNSVFQSETGRNVLQQLEQVADKEKGYQATIRYKKNNKKSDIRIYLRHEMDYFGIGFRIIYLFNYSKVDLGLSSPIVKFNDYNDENILSINELEVTNRRQAIQGIQLNTKVNGKDLNKFPQISKLSNVVPLKVKIIKIILIIQIIVATLFASLNLGLHYESVYFQNDVLEYTQIKSQLIQNLIDLGYFGRLLQIAADASTGLPYYQYRANISTVSQKLQKNQFWIVNNEQKLSSYNFHNYEMANNSISWYRRQNGDLYLQNNTVSLTVFDVVTSSSALTLATPNNLAFRRKLEEESNGALSNTYRSLFHIRYTTLFGLLPSKLANWESVNNYSLQLLDYIIQDSIIVFIVISAYFLIIFLVLSTCIIKILNRVGNMIFMFNTLQSEQINSKILACEKFIYTNFEHSYEVVMKKKEKTNFRSSFNDYQQFINRCSNDKLFKTQVIISIKKQDNEQSKKQVNRQSVPKIQNGQQENKDQTQMPNQQSKKFVSINNLLSAGDNKPPRRKSLFNDDFPKQDQKSPLFLKNSLSLDEELAQQSKNLYQIKKKIVIFAFIFVLLLYSYFIMEFLNNKELNYKRRETLQINQILNDNSILIKCLKLYGLESAIDNTKFQGYQLLSEQFISFSNQVYEIQRKLDQLTSCGQSLTQIGQKIFQANKQNLCAQPFSQNLILFPHKSMTVDECQSLADGVLKKGLRVSIVSYIQKTLKSITQSSIQQSISNQTLTQIIKLQKYILSSLHQLLSSFYSAKKVHITEQSKDMLGMFCSIIIIIVFMVLLSFYLIPKMIMINIKGSIHIYEIVSGSNFSKDNQYMENYRSELLQLFN